MDEERLAPGELEGLVMEVLWAAGAPLAAAGVRDRLGPTRPLAYTTVMTVLVRLFDKGLVERERVGRAFVYRPRSSREEHAAARMSEVLEAATDDSLVLARFVASLSPSQRAELRRVVEDESSVAPERGGGS